MYLPEKYNPKEAEQKWIKYWKDHKIYKFNENSDKQTFAIDTPPPTVSGRMHIGHAWSFSQGDFIARYNRMKGKNVFYPWGTDDNGLPTERLVEKLKKVKSTKMTKHDFIDLCKKTIAEEKPRFNQDWIDLGISAEFENSYSTIDDKSIKTSQISFIDLYEKKLIVQEEYPFSWCMTCQTAIAQAEFENIEKDSLFSDIKFNVNGEDLIIATTRPEMIPACVAVLSHPNDKRYRKFIGKKAKVPLFDYEVPILADDKVDQTKGTGIVMCCTFGDKVDIEWWKQFKLPMKIVFEKYGKMNKNAGKYAGLTISEARKQIILDLEKEELLVGKKPIKHPVNVHDKCGTDLEFMQTKQWFIKILGRKKDLLEAAKKINWYPEHMKHRYDNWVENLNWDWCISRQRHYGVPFPVWYCKKCNNVKLAEITQLPVFPNETKPKTACKCGSDDFEPEMDVMDTWATSSLTPQIALNWIKNPKNFDEHFPMTVRFQAHDIIRTWAFYTIVKADYHHNKIPWHNIIISGNVMDPTGEKMSKSKGNIIAPQDIIQKYSADALRFWAGATKLGEDIKFSEKDVLTGQKMVTKMFNACKFAIMNLENYNLEKPNELCIMDKWILSKLHRLIESCTESFDVFDFSRTKADTEKFFYQILCDSYIEIIKDRIYNEDKYGSDPKLSAQYALYRTILSVLKLMAPIMPFITEEIYHMYISGKEKHKSIHISEWPLFDKNMIDENAELAGDILVDILSAVRKYKSEKQLSLKTEIKTLRIKCDEEYKNRIKLIDIDLKAVIHSEKIEFTKNSDIKCERFPVEIGIEMK